MFDYHVHTSRSVDCDTAVEDSCRAAIRAGITEIAFTDHVDFMPTDMGYDYYNYDAYQEDIDRVQQEFGDQLVILRGAEIDFHTDTQDQVEAWLTTHNHYDFIIGSVHYGDDQEIIFPEYFATRTIDEVMQGYLEQLCAAAEIGWFDTLGHIDLPKRYAPASAGIYDPLAREDQLRDLFRILIARNTSFEINTSGIRQAPKTSMPAAQIVALYVACGGSLITTGTDSHFAHHIGNGLPETLKMLQLCGITHISSFRNRTRNQVPIASLTGAVPA